MVGDKTIRFRSPYRHSECQLVVSVSLFYSNDKIYQCVCGFSIVHKVCQVCRRVARYVSKCDRKRCRQSSRLTYFTNDTSDSKFKQKPITEREGTMSNISLPVDMVRTTYLGENPGSILCILFELNVYYNVEMTLLSVLYEYVYEAF